MAVAAGAFLGPVSAPAVVCNFETRRLVINRPHCLDLQRPELAQQEFVACLFFCL